MNTRDAIGNTVSFFVYRAFAIERQVETGRDELLERSRELRALSKTLQSDARRLRHEARAARDLSIA